MENRNRDITIALTKTAASPRKFQTPLISGKHNCNKDTSEIYQCTRKRSNSSLVAVDDAGQAHTRLTQFFVNATTDPRKKTSLGESLAESHAYKPSRDSGETLGEREKSCQESCRESHQESSRDSLSLRLG